MRSLICLNKFTKLQKILTTLNNQSNIVASSSFQATNVISLRQQRWLTLAHNSTIPRLKKDFSNTTSNYSTSSTNTTNSKEHSTASSSKASSTIDEFRAREEAEMKRDECQEEPKQDEEAKKAKADAVRTKILEAALSHVPTLGWTRNAIIQGAEEAGYPSVVHGMFPEGGFALVAFFNGKCNDLLVQKLQEETNSGKTEVANPSDFLYHAVKTRLEMIEPVKQQWPQALGLIALPQNAPTALAQLLTLVDDICYYTGDRSVDVGWYTRRIGLATIFKMTELYMLQDSSPQHAKTWEFLRNRLDEAVHIQSVFMQTGDVTGSFQKSFNSAFVTARNILGLGYGRH